MTDLQVFVELFNHGVTEGTEAPGIGSPVARGTMFLSPESITAAQPIVRGISVTRIGGLCRSVLSVADEGMSFGGLSGRRVVSGSESESGIGRKIGERRGVALCELRAAVVNPARPILNSCIWDRVGIKDTHEPPQIS